MTRACLQRPAIADTLRRPLLNGRAPVFSRHLRPHLQPRIADGPEYSSPSRGDSPTETGFYAGGLIPRPTFRPCRILFTRIHVAAIRMQPKHGRRIRRMSIEDRMHGTRTQRRAADPQYQLGPNNYAASANARYQNGRLPLPGVHSIGLLRATNHVRDKIVGRSPHRGDIGPTAPQGSSAYRYLRKEGSWRLVLAEGAEGDDGWEAALPEQGNRS